MSRTWPGNTSTDYLTIPASSVFNITTNVCFMAIVRVPTLRNVGALEHMAVIGDVAGRGFYFSYTDAEGQLDMASPTGTDTFGGLTTNVVVNTWLAFCMFGSHLGTKTFRRYNYTTMVSATPGGTNTIVAPTTDPGVIGNWLSPAANNSFIGDMDRLLIGQGTPSEADFQAWARAGTLPPGLTVLGYWILSPSGTATNPEVDLSGNGLNITSITGTTASAAFVLPDAGPSIVVGDACGTGDLRRVPV